MAERTLGPHELHRATIHMVSARDYPYVAAGLRGPASLVAEGHASRRGRRPDAHGGPPCRGPPGRGPTRAQGDPGRARPRQRDVRWRRALGRPGARSAIGHVGASPRRPLRPRRRWIGASDPGEADGIEHLVRRYLAAFGPSTRKDLAMWAGLPLAALEPALTRTRLRRFRNERREESLDLPRAPLPPAETPAPVRFLPTWTPRSSRTCAARRSSPRSTARGCSTRRPRIRSRPSS
jgi:DNA glycosylase AlkZ-like